MQTTEEYRAYILRLRDEQHRPPAELWPAAKRYLGEAEAAALLGPEPPAEPRPVPARRQPRPAGAVVPPAPDFGVGTEFAALTKTLLIPMCRSCADLAAEMNRLTPDDVERDFDKWAADLRARGTSYGWWAKGKAAAMAVATGLVRDPLWETSDPVGSMLRIAIRNAKAAQPPEPPPAESQSKS